MNKYVKTILLLSGVFLTLVFISNKYDILAKSTNLYAKASDAISITSNILFEKPIRILFVGDIMLDRNVERRIQKNGFESIFKGISEIFKDKDIVVGNLEGTLTNNPSIALKDHTILHFTFKPEYAEKLKDTGFTLFSLANNHALDFYKDGYDETIRNLENAQIDYFGSPNNDMNISKTISINKENICFIGYHDLYTYNEKPVLDEIKSINNNCDFTIVFAHWGEEYKTKENKRQELLAHKFIDTGADLVIGAHPHVVEPVEIYKNKAIFYSLGNFVFDQDFSWDTLHGLTFYMEILKDKVTYTLVPVTAKYSILEISNKDDADKIFKVTGYKNIELKR